jgi:hypothetical protein
MIGLRYKLTHAITSTLDLDSHTADAMFITWLDPFAQRMETNGMPSIQTVRRFSSSDSHHWLQSIVYLL